MELMQPPPGGANCCGIDAGIDAEEPEMLRWLSVWLLLVTTQTVVAAPPDPGSEDYEQLAPYSGWLHDQIDVSSGIACCSISDCRTIEWRTRDGQVEAFVSSAKYVSAPDTWVTVPAAVIHREVNPTGRAVACWSAYHATNAGFYCFWLPILA